MKVQELFEAKRVATDKGYYTPGYDAENKHPVGTMADWIARMKLTPEDISKGMAEARNLPSFKALKDFGATEVKREKALKNGTFTFKNPAPGKYTGGSPTYNVYVNGLIRIEAESESRWLDGERRATRLKSPKPRLIAGNKIGSLAKIYGQAFDELLQKISKKTGANAKFTKAKHDVQEAND